MIPPLPERCSSHGKNGSMKDKSRGFLPTHTIHSAPLHFKEKSPRWEAQLGLSGCSRRRTGLQQGALGSCLISHSGGQDFRDGPVYSWQITSRLDVGKDGKDAQGQPSLL